MPAMTKYPCYVATKVSFENYTLLHELADSRDTSIATILREAIAQYLSQRA